ncbi:hypothetical protein [Chloroflexus sp.]|uniref:hypothetical protein n=1 Tax=Chloroflexus sp. TaxID=1904827 RepID=UPI002ACE1E4B|nr:hypothetical protein [Chloroflexus sp.]
MADAMAASRDACHQRLATIFPAGALVWIEAEEYDSAGMFWRVTLLYRNPSGQWERLRYRYDIPTEVVFFMGSTPISDEEAARIRRTAPRLPTSRALLARSV